jgi:hypothetical protein
MYIAGPFVVPKTHHHNYYLNLRTDASFNDVKLWCMYKEPDDSRQHSFMSSFTRHEVCDGRTSQMPQNFRHLRRMIIAALGAV